MSFGAAIVARLAEASAAGHDGIVIVFPEVPEARVPEWVRQGLSQAPRANLARRVVEVDPEWRIPIA